MDDKDLQEMCPKIGWCKKLKTFFNRRTLEILHNKCIRPCPRRNSYIVYWLEKAGLEVPEKYQTLSFRGKIQAARLGQPQMTKKPCGCGGGKKKKPPSMVEKAKSVTKAGIDFIKSGMKLVSDKEAEQRLNICLDCDQSYYDKLGKLRCKECGCYLAVKTKIACAECPLYEGDKHLGSDNPYWGQSEECDDGV